MSMPIESMLLAVNSNFLVFSVSSDDMMGQSFASLVSMVAAAESAMVCRSHYFFCDFTIPMPPPTLFPPSYQCRSGNTLFSWALKRFIREIRGNTNRKTDI